MTPESGATAVMFAIDEQTIDYLKSPTRRRAGEIAETYAKTAGLWADASETAVYPRVLKFDLSSVTRNMAGPATRTRFATADLASKGLAKPTKSLQTDKCLTARSSSPRLPVAPTLPTRATSLPPRSGAQRQPLRAETQTVGQNLVCPRFESGGNLFERSRPAARNGKTRLRYRRFCLHHLQRHEWRAGFRKTLKKSSTAICTPPPYYQATATSTAVSIRMRNRLSSLRLRWSLPTRWQYPFRY